MKKVGDFEVKITRKKTDIEAAQKLRFEVFNLEMHKGLEASYERGLDADPYDSACEHLIVRDFKQNRIVGTYRLLLGSRTNPRLGFYSEQEFDLRRIKNLKGELLELGRSCVHREYRDRALIEVMWQTIAEYIRRHNVRYLFGCASLPTTDPRDVSGAFALFKDQYYAAEKCRVYPLPEKSFGALQPNATVRNPRGVLLRLPSLIKGYLRLGAKVCGPPALDTEFGTTDFFLLMDVKRLSPEHRHRFGFARPKVRHAVG